MIFRPLAPVIALLLPLMVLYEKSVQYRLTSVTKSRSSKLIGNSTAMVVDLGDMYHDY